MANFQLAHPFVVKNEGGYVFNKSDTGGETYQGVSRNNFPNWQGWAIVDSHKPLKRGDIIDSPELHDMLEKFYKQNFWDDCHLDSVKSQPFATYFYDFHVTAGGNATKCLQRLLRLEPDGGFGPKTLAAVNNYSGDLLTDFHIARKEYYRRIGTGSNAQFLTGWLNRCNSMYAGVRVG